MAAAAAVEPGDKRPAEDMSEEDFLRFAKRWADSNRREPGKNDARIRALLKGITQSLSAAEKQTHELYSILLPGEQPALPKGRASLGKVQASPSIPIGATVVESTEDFVGRYTAAGQPGLEFWDTRQGTGTKLRFSSGKDVFIMGTFTKKSLLCDLLPPKHVEAAMQNRA